MDAVISIGGQSFVDGLVRILGPALQGVRSPLPLAVPGLTNGVLNIRGIQQVFPGTGGAIELALEIDLTAEVLLVASVVGETVNLAFAQGSVTLPGASGSVTEQARSGTLATDPGTGTISGLTNTLNLALNGLAGTVTLPQPANPAPLSLGQIIGTIDLPAGVGDLGLPLPAVVPVAVNFTRDGALTARVLLTPLVNDEQVLGAEASITAATGFGLEFSFVAPPTVQVNALHPTAITALQGALAGELNALVGQLLQGLPALTQPATNLPAVVANIAQAIPGAAAQSLANAFGNLRARTGRLISPVAAAGSSCDVLALPTDGKARITVAGGSPLLEIGLDRLPILPPSPFPPFTPTAALDAGVTLSIMFVRDLLACLIEKFPNLSLPTLPPSFGGSPSSATATWSGVTLTAGPIAFTGTLTLSITGTPGAPGPLVPKTITLTFAAVTAVGAPLVIGPALTSGLSVRLPLAFDLNGLASITALRLAGPPAITFGFGLGTGLLVLLGILAGLFVLPAAAVPFPIVWAGFFVLAFLVVAAPLIVTAIVGGLLGGNIGQVLGGLHRLLESPAGLPPGIFEAFGEFIPTTMVVDDLVAGGVLQTPTSPWAVLPLVPKDPRRPPPGDSPDSPRPPDRPRELDTPLGSTGRRGSARSE